MKENNDFLLFYLLSPGVALSAQENEGNDLSQPRAISTCGAATISRGEFSLCSLAHPVYLSVWNLEDTHRTVELSFGYGM